MTIFIYVRWATIELARPNVNAARTRMLWDRTERGEMVFVIDPSGWPDIIKIIKEDETRLETAVFAV